MWERCGGAQEAKIRMKIHMGTQGFWAVGPNGQSRQGTATSTDHSTLLAILARGFKAQESGSNWPHLGSVTYLLAEVEGTFYLKEH